MPWALLATSSVFGDVVDCVVEDLCLDACSLDWLYGREHLQGRCRRLSTGSRALRDSTKLCSP